MMKSLIEEKKLKCRMFQVLLLNNDARREVEVQEGNYVDFLKVQEHLTHGGSVFITSKNSQKLHLPKEKKALQNKKKSQKTAALYFNHI
jgi:hypothetical protein